MRTPLLQTDEQHQDVDTRFVAEQRLINFAGQPLARLNRNTIIYEVETRRSALITTLSPLLFFAPDVHLDKLETVFIDRTINKVHWKSFIGKLQDEWREFILYVSPPQFVP